MPDAFCQCMRQGFRSGWCRLPGMPACSSATIILCDSFPNWKRSSVLTRPGPPNSSITYAGFYAKTLVPISPAWSRGFDAISLQLHQDGTTPDQISSKTLSKWVRDHKAAAELKARQQAPKKANGRAGGKSRCETVTS